MKSIWNTIRISIAGARLSHLTAKDKIWDPGSMTEQVRAVFSLLQKAKLNGSTASIRHYLSVKAFQKLEKEINQLGLREMEKRRSLTEISILSVRPGKASRPDGFRALICGRANEPELAGDRLFGLNQQKNGERRFAEQWYFIRQGEWWVLDGWRTL